MRPWFEKVSVPAGQSWVLFDRQLDAFAFNWHYHPEFELTLTLNSAGERFVGDHVAPYGDGDLVLVGPNLPHAWQSRHTLDAGRCAGALARIGAGAAEPGRRRRAPAAGDAGFRRAAGGAGA